MAGSGTPEALAEGVLAGDRHAVARAITLVERGGDAAGALVRALYPSTGRAHIVGITGPPGVGKSTLVSGLVGHVRGLGSSVGVVSVDPSSPFTNGALLGDRIRLADHFVDPEVFIRSMGTRGHPGGLAAAALQAVLVLDAAGKDVVFLETVGAGQSEVAVAAAADTVVLVLMPGSGDAVQALKAGIMEIPDVIAVNKRDHQLADALVRDLRQTLSLAAPERRPPLVLTEATRGEGVEELWRLVGDHRAALAGSGLLAERRAASLAREVVGLAAGRARGRLEGAAAADPALRELLERVAAREVDPLAAADAMMQAVFGGNDGDARDTEPR